MRWHKCRKDSPHSIQNTISIYVLTLLLFPPINHFSSSLLHALNNNNNSNIPFSLCPNPKSQSLFSNQIPITLSNPTKVNLCIKISSFLQFPLPFFSLFSLQDSDALSLRHSLFSSLWVPLPLLKWLTLRGFEFSDCVQCAQFSRDPENLGA